jgi:hypothetical protein
MTSSFSEKNTCKMVVENICFLLIVDNGLSFIFQGWYTNALAFSAFGELKKSLWVSFDIRGYALPDLIIN